MADRSASTRLGEFIQNQRRVANLSIRELARLTRISNPYLSQVERGLYKPSAKVLKSIADALHISAETLFARAGLVEEHPDTDIAFDVEEAIRMDDRLSTEQKQALIDVYRNFVGPG